MRPGYHPHPISAMTFILLIAAATVTALAAAELFQVRYRRMARERRRGAYRTLHDSFRAGGVQADVVAATQSYFDQITGVRDFPVRVEDGLLAVYGLAREDVNDAVAIIASTLDCVAPADRGDASRAGEQTVEELVGAVQRVYLGARAATAARARSAMRA